MLHGVELDEKRAGVLATISFGRGPGGTGNYETLATGRCVTGLHRSTHTVFRTRPA